MTERNPPGAYVQEIPGSVRPIAAVPTSRTVFIGRTARGQVGEPAVVRSMDEFRATFGGGPVGSAVDKSLALFFTNGGTEAVVIRLFKPDSTGVTGRAFIDTGPVVLEAASEGEWGRRLEARAVPSSKGLTRALGLRRGTFDLEVRDTPPGGSTVTEVHKSLVLADGPQRVDQVLARESRLVRCKTVTGKAAPTKEFVPAVGGSDGLPLDEASFTGASGGLRFLERANGFNLLYIPPYREGDVDPAVLAAAAERCRQLRAVLLVDPPRIWSEASEAAAGIEGIRRNMGKGARNAALFFPYLRRRAGLSMVDLPPGPAVAGIIARTDAREGVWKAPAGTEAEVRGAEGSAVDLSDSDIGRLGPLGVNCLRKVHGRGLVVWGSRTLEGHADGGSEWRYLSVVRLSLFIEESLRQGLEWTAWEPNGPALWALVRSAAEAFLIDLYHRGAFQGSTPREAFFVKCGRDTTTQAELDGGHLVLQAGIATLRPAEFVSVSVPLRTGGTSPR
ncbi:MAG: phage tail sheath family protein [Methanomassiliicoccus sp.]|nr:phage tail sheath family protein [Methanomassiliicoccus sp.]